MRSIELPELAVLTLFGQVQTSPDSPGPNRCASAELASAIIGRAGRPPRQSLLGGSWEAAGGGDARARRNNRPGARAGEQEASNHFHMKLTLTPDRQL